MSWSEEGWPTWEEVPRGSPGSVSVEETRGGSDEEEDDLFRDDEEEAC